MSKGFETNLTWRPSGEITRLRQRAQALAKIRYFFAQKKVWEVQTPSLASASALEAEIEQFAVPLPQGKTAWLTPSPEFYMKRLLAAGSGPIYQICSAFRKGEIGQRHNPEFTLLEFYLLDHDDFSLMDVVEELIRLLAPETLPAERITYGELFKKNLGLDAWGLDEKKFVAICDQHSLRPPAALLPPLTPAQEWRDFLFSFIIEPQLGFQAPIFVTHYPKETAALAQLDPNNNHLARRFELYINGLELCNGFWELIDPLEQAARFEQIKLEKGRAEELDFKFLAALQAGLPPCAGVAIGLERLLCALYGGQLADWMSFNWERS